VALTQLLEALRAQAAEQRAAESARADAEIARLSADARTELERRRSEHVGRASRAAQDGAQRMLGEARAQAARSVLEARDRLLARVRRRLEAGILSSLTDSGYRAALPAELEQALERLPPGNVVVRTRPELAGVLADAVRGRSGVVVESALDLGVGFLAVATEAEVEVDATLDAKLEHRWPAVAVAVLAEVVA
jgi:vacuolar-type H+-ATPase subunit E/Vma4